jgi:hypothetical protein
MKKLMPLRREWWRLFIVLHHQKPQVLQIDYSWSCKRRGHDHGPLLDLKTQSWRS